MKRRRGGAAGGGRGGGSAGRKRFKAAGGGGRVHASWPAGAKGQPAMMATCDSGKEKDAAKELITLLEASVERLEMTGSASHLIDEVDESPAEEDESVEAMLKKEIDALRAENAGDAGSGFLSVNLHMKGVCSIVVTKEGLDVCRLIQDIFDRIQSEKLRLSRFLIRLIPLMHTCHAGMDDVIELAKPLIDTALSAEAPPTRWAIHLSRRNSHLARNELIEALAKLVDPKHKVCLDDPATVIIVDVCMGLAGVSIVQDWKNRGFGGFHLRDLQDSVCGSESADLENPKKGDKSVKRCKEGRT